jgi:hypothetical protein
MSTIHVTKEPVVLEGFQAILKPSKYGYTLSALIPESLIPALEQEREQNLEWCKAKTKGTRAVEKPEPWDSTGCPDGYYKVKFSWNDQPNRKGEVEKPRIVDSENKDVTNPELPVFSGSTVKLAFRQKPYVAPGNTYGTTLKLVCVQLVTVGEAGVSGVSESEDPEDLFGESTGFKNDDFVAAPVDESDDF